jgi:OPA family glycerol-3-phosphate transporter-like MFS transporter
MRNPLGLDAAFRQRRFLNWFPLGVAYAMLYMGRYSIVPAKDDLKELMTNADLGNITAVGAIVYGTSFLLNGPMTDRIGGRKAMIISTLGSGLVNIIMGIVLWKVLADHPETTLPLVPLFIGLYGVNMYFQSFAAVSIVKVNAAWFHITERGVFGGIFGIMISSGLFLAYTVSPMLMSRIFPDQPYLYFGIPGAVLLVMCAVTYLIIKDTPADVGYHDFSTGTDTEFDQADRLSLGQILKRILTHRIVLTIACIEFCTGVIRNGVMYWFPSWADQSTMPGVREWLGVGLFAAGVFGGMTAGMLSDLLFQSRRPPVAGVLYSILIVIFITGTVMIWQIDPASQALPVIMFSLVILVSFCVIGTHGVLSGSATADFGGKQATATAVGLIDGFVYLGVAVQSFCLGHLTSKEELIDGVVVTLTTWTYWMPFLVPFALVGFLLSLRLWNVKPKLKGAQH